MGHMQVMGLGGGRVLPSLVGRASRCLCYVGGNESTASFYACIANEGTARENSGHSRVTAVQSGLTSVYRTGKVGGCGQLESTLGFRQLASAWEEQSESPDGYGQRFFARGGVRVECACTPLLYYGRWCEFKCKDGVKTRSRRLFVLCGKVRV